MNDTFTSRRAVRGPVIALLFAAAVPFGLIALAGCGDSGQETGTVVAPNQQTEQANKNMEDFMKSQDASAKKK